MELAAELTAGSVLAMTGDLGAGKTTFTKAIAKGLGIDGPVTSPTFTILQEYKQGRLPLYHFDVYRVYDEEELFEIGFDEYLHGDGVCIIEWADLVEDMLPEDCIRINIKYDEKDPENGRIIEIE